MVDNLIDLLQYQPESVVSRTLIKKEKGTVTLFAFAKGQGLSEHTAPFDAMVHVLEGTAEISIENDKFQIKRGQFIILPANKPHSVTATEDFKMLLTMIRSD